MSRFGALGNRSFWRFFVGNAVSRFGNKMAPVALTFGVLHGGGGATDLGLVLGAPAIPTLLLVLVGGVFGDRLERRRVLIVTDLVMAVSQGAVGAILLVGGFHLLPILLLQLAYGAASAFAAPASIGVVPDLVETERLQQANSLIGLTRNVAGIAGPAAGGLLAALVAPGLAVVIDAVTFLVSAAALAGLPALKAAADIGDSSILGDLRAGWTEFVSRSWVWMMVVGFLVYQASVLPAMYVLGPLFAEDHYNGPGAWAAVLIAQSAGALLMSLVMLRWRPRRPLAVACVLVLLDIPFLVLLCTGAPLALVLAAAAVAAAGLAVGDTAWETSLQSNIPPRALSRVSAYDWLGSLAINPLGFALIGPFNALLGSGTALAVILSVNAVLHVALALSRPIRTLRYATSAPTDREAESAVEAT